MAEILIKVQLLIEFVLYHWTATNREDRVVSHEGYNMTASVGRAEFVQSSPRPRLSLSNMKEKWTLLLISWAPNEYK